MTLFDFRSNDFPEPKAKRSASIKPDMNERAFEDKLLFQNVEHRGGDIEEISVRLANLADRIGAFNTAKQNGGFSIRSVSGYLPYFGSALAKKQNSIVSVHGAKLGISEQPINVDLGEHTHLAIDAEGRVWPELSTAPQTNLRSLEDKIAEQSDELTKRCIQIADLSNIRQEQANELLIANDEIDYLRKSIAELQQAITQRDAGAVAATQKLILLDKENLALKARLNEALQDSVEFSQRLLKAETTLNDKVVEIAATQETVERLKAELAANRDGKIQVAVATEEEAYQRHRDELKRQRARFDNQISETLATVAGRDRQIKDLEAARAELTARFESLSKVAATFEGIQQRAQEENKSQAEQIEFLETQLKVEREISEVKMKALIAEFHQERLGHYAKEQASAEARKDIVLLLPKLAARRNGFQASEQDYFISSNNVA